MLYGRDTTVGLLWTYVDVLRWDNYVACLICLFQLTATYHMKESTLSPENYSSGELIQSRH